MPKFHVVLQSQTDEHKRYVTVSTVPCTECGGGPDRDTCNKCKGAGELEATEKFARAFVEDKEREYVDFRLDDPATIRRYPTLPQDALDAVQETCAYYPKDTHLVDGRFIRGGKVLGQNKLHRGWLHLHLQEKPYKVASIGRVDQGGPKAVVTAGQFGVPLKNMFGGANVWDWDTNTIKCSLHTSTYVPDIDTHDFFNDCTNEVTGTGYTAGGVTLTASAPSYDTATDQIRLDATDASWATSTITARIAIVYQSTGTSTTSPLISFVNFGADVSTTAGTFQITWDATGIFIIDIT